MANDLMYVPPLFQAQQLPRAKYQLFESLPQNLVETGDDNIDIFTLTNILILILLLLQVSGTCGSQVLIVSFALWLSVLPGFPDSHGWYLSWLFLLSRFLYM